MSREAPLNNESLPLNLATNLAGPLPLQRLAVCTQVGRIV